MGSGFLFRLIAVPYFGGLASCHLLDGLFGNDGFILFGDVVGGGVLVTVLDDEPRIVAPALGLDQGNSPLSFLPCIRILMEPP